MEHSNAHPPRSRQSGSGLQMVLLALLLIAIAAAADIAWMTPGSATTAARVDVTATHEQTAAAVDAMAAAHHSDEASTSGVESAARARTF